jgi:hypothetical protein
MDIKDLIEKHNLPEEVSKEIYQDIVEALTKTTKEFIHNLDFHPSVDFIGRKYFMKNGYTFMASVYPNGKVLVELINKTPKSKTAQNIAEAIGWIQRPEKF